MRFLKKKLDLRCAAREPLQNWKLNLLIFTLVKVCCAKNNIDLLQGVSMYGAGLKVFSHYFFLLAASIRSSNVLTLTEVEADARPTSSLASVFLFPLFIKARSSSPRSPARLWLCRFRNPDIRIAVHFAIPSSPPQPSPPFSCLIVRASVMRLLLEFVGRRLVGVFHPPPLFELLNKEKSALLRV